MIQLCSQLADAFRTSRLGRVQSAELVCQQLENFLVPCATSSRFEEQFQSHDCTEPFQLRHRVPSNRGFRRLANVRRQLHAGLEVAPSSESACAPLTLRSEHAPFRSWGVDQRSLRPRKTCAERPGLTIGEAETQHLEACHSNGSRARFAALQDDRLPRSAGCPLVWSAFLNLFASRVVFSAPSKSPDCQVRPLLLRLL